MPSNASIKIAVPVETLIAEYQAGATIRELGKRYGCSFQNIAMRLRHAGVQMHPPHYTKPAVEPKQCPTCGRMFKPYSKTQRFCRMECVRIKQYCKRGHLLTEENRYHFPGSSSRCKECVRIRNQAYRAKKAVQS